MPNVSVTADVENARSFAHALMALEETFNTDVHLSSATKAAFAILEDAFGVETDAMARINEDDFMHVYDWDEVGEFTGRLFNPILSGRGGRRTVSWTWLPSMNRVPIDPNDYPADFDTSRLNHNHIFVWKAPVMEYGITVHVHRKQSKLLVIPYPDSYSGLGEGKVMGSGSRSVLLTRHPYSFSPGEKAGVVGNFTAWFAAWWGSGRANDILRDVFEPQRDNAFRQSFHARTSHLQSVRPRQSQITAVVSSQAAMQGKRIASRITKDMEAKYLQMAASKMRRY